MSKILLGCTPPGRYPRWGYLDRLETNAVMPRACMSSLALCGLLGSLLLLLHSFHPASPALLARAGPTSHQPIAPLPLPPPPIQASPVIPKIHVAQSTSGQLIVVEDDVVVDYDEAWTSPTGDQNGAGNGDVWPGLLVSDTDWDSLASVASPLRPDDFVALEREPELLLMPDPEYPELARDAGIEGTVLVRAQVGADGSVLETLVLQSVLGLDEAALEAVAGATFRPARQQGLPVAAWVIVPIEFRLCP